MPYTDGKHSLAKLQVSISKLQVSISEIKQYFHHDIYMGGSLLLWLAAAVWVDWRSRAAAGVCITATVTGKLWYRRKEQHLQPSLRGRSTRKSRRASWPGARRARRCSRKATVSNGSLKSCRTCESGGRSRGGGSSTGCSTGGGSAGLARA